MSRLVPTGGNDVVYTPDNLALSIINHFNPVGSLLEPACGNGAFLQFMPNADWCELSKGRDFFSYTTKVDWIITNPPWSKFKLFLDHSMELADNIIFLAPITHFVTKARLRSVREHGFGIKEFWCVETPKFPWPQSGFQLAAGHIVRGHKECLKFT